jgi:hypothetical protein
MRRSTVSTYRLTRSLLPVFLLLATVACRSDGAMSVNRLGADQSHASADTAAATPVSVDRGVRDPAVPVDPWSPGDPGPVDVSVEINTRLENRAISPHIYGNNHDVREIGKQRWGVLRVGGNRLTAYNWENNASNAGSDYLFQNDALMSKSDSPAQPILDLIDAASTISAPAVITLSNADYVAADKNGGGDVRRSGAHFLTTRFKSNHARKPTPFTSVPDVNDADVYQDEFVAFLKAKRPAAKIMLSMDNEPELWSHTHAEIFRSPVTYADLWKRNHDFARAAKDVWPGIEVLGFVSYGYSGFTNLQDAADAADRNFIDWYLDQARAAERREASRLIDYLDLHWYPEAQGGGERITGQGSSPAVVSAREQAPRSLWDRSYSEASWVQKSIGGPIDLLHWLQAKIDRHYPNTKLAFSEWNYGGGNHISGSIATADVLGIFGKFGVSLATYWPLTEHEAFAYAAFRAFRNYDDQGSSFGDVSVAASSSATDQATVYASMQSDRPERTVIVLINKDTAPRRAGLRIRHDVSYATAKVFVITGTQPALIGAPALRAVSTNAFRYDMPAQSVSVIVPQR